MPISRKQLTAPTKERILTMFKDLLEYARYDESLEYYQELVSELEDLLDEL